MKVLRVDDPSAFVKMTRPLLLLDEARHNLILGISSTLIDQPTAYTEFYGWVVDYEDGPVAAAMMTPPHNIAISHALRDDALEQLATALWSDSVKVPGVSGALPEADVFAGAWERSSGTQRELRMALQIYKLETVQPASGVEGTIRPAGDEDRALLREWLDAFIAEARATGDVDTMIRRRLHDADGGLFFWERDGLPVSLAGCGGRTPNGIRVGPVYTPPASRGHGYASALVATMSASMLAKGIRFCFLYTDAANPTSNAIYQRIGYEFICDARDYVFA